MQTRFDRPLNALVFGGFALVSIMRAVSAWPSARGMGHAVGLLVLALLSYVYASRGQRHRIAAILVYLVGWFRSPAWGLLCLFLLWLVAAYRRAAARLRREREEKELARRAEAGPAEAQLEGEGKVSDGGSMGRILLTMKMAAESEGKIRAFHASFSSPYGDGVVPLLIATEGGERGLYVESGPWDDAKEEACLRWLALLRTSDREDLEVEIRSDVDVSERLRFYTGRAPRVVFELLGLLHVRVFEQPDFGKENAATLRRLAPEYLDVELAGGIAGLETLDRLVVDLLRPSGQVLPSTLLLAGCFFGEALVAAYGGRWNVQGSRGVSVEIASPAGTMDANVFGKVQKLFENGMEDSTAWMARSIGERLDESDSSRGRG